jgi:hypothetical protein
VKARTFLRVLADTGIVTRPRRTFWEAKLFAAELQRLLLPTNAALRRHAVRDHVRHLLGNVRPVRNETIERAKTAVAWLLRAQQATPDDGVSFGYFPCASHVGPWVASYPETTCYIVTSLLRYAARFADATARAAAIAMARWEIGVQMHSGAVQGGPVCAPEKQSPAAFNTGMVLDGWCSAYLATHDGSFVDAARRAADFLVSDLSDEGYFRTNGSFVSDTGIKTYTCLCAWSLYRFGEITGEPRYIAAALKSVSAALRQQQSNGWLANNCITRPEAPLTHTIGYTLQGVLEVGLLAGRADFVAAVRLSTDQVLRRASPDGYLPGRFYPDWEPASLSSCLTGAAQIAVICYRLAQSGFGEQYRREGDRLVDYLKALQALDTPLPDINGAIAGSSPLFGQYMRGGYPNWAIKYLLDALMLQHDCSLPERSGTASMRSPGDP